MLSLRASLGAASLVLAGLAVGTALLGPGDLSSVRVDSPASLQAVPLPGDDGGTTEDGRRGEHEEERLRARLADLQAERQVLAPLAHWFEEFNQGFGSSVDPHDAHNLGAWLGVDTTGLSPAQTVDVLDRASRAEAASPTLAVVRGIRLKWPTLQVEVVGFHQSNHDGAQNMDPRHGPWLTMEDRGRDTVPHGSADIAVPRDTTLVSVVTGTVKRSGTYTLYCQYSDDFLVVEPDGMPGIEVKLLHIDGVMVRSGDRVVAGETPIAPRATILPFESQVNEHTEDPGTPHVHVEVVDTSIKDRPSPGGGC